MFGIDSFSGITLGIDAEFKGFTFLRKGTIWNTKEYIECDLDEIIVIRPIDATNINCELVSRDGNRLKYECFLTHTKGFDVETKRVLEIHKLRMDGDLKVEYFIFGAPKPNKTKYGIQIYNEKSELVFASEHRYLRPVGMVSVDKNGGGNIMQERRDQKLGVMLTCFPTFWIHTPEMFVGRQVVTAGICYGDWQDNKRLLGVRPVFAFRSGGGSATYPDDELQFMVVDVSNL